VYTFVFISSNNYLWRLNTLEHFEEIGLKEGIHFVKKEVEIKNGEIKDLGLIVVPELNEKSCSSQIPMLQAMLWFRKIIV